MLKPCSPAAWQAACCDCLESVPSLSQKSTADFKSRQTRKLISLLLRPFCHKGPDLSLPLFRGFGKLTQLDFKQMLDDAPTTGHCFFLTLSDFKRLRQLSPERQNSPQSTPQAVCAWCQELCYYSQPQGSEGKVVLC